MANTPLRKSPLQMPTNSAEFLRTFVYDRAPTTADYKNFRISDLWIHRNPSATPPYGYYVLVDKPSQTGIWLDLGGKEEGDIQTLTGDTGGPIPPDTNGNVNILGGTGISIAGVSASNTLTVNSTGGGLSWQVDTTSPISLVGNIGNIENGASLITYNLPSTCTVGDLFAVVASTANGFQIVANAGQTIQLGSTATSSGGTITSTSIGDVVFFLCTTTDTSFFVLNSIGNLTVA